MDRKEELDQLELQVLRDLMGPQALVVEVAQVHQVPLDHQDQMVLLEALDRLVVRVDPVDPDPRDHRVQQEEQDSLEHQENRDKLVLQEILDPRDYQDLLEDQVVVVLLEEQVKQAFLGRQEHPVHQELQGLLDQLDLLVHLEVLVQLDSQGLQGLQPVLGLLVLWVLVELLVPLAQMAQLELQELQGLRVQSERLVIQDQQDHLAMVQEGQDLKEQPELRVQEGKRDLQEILERREA